MALLLCIDTALETATVGVCNEESALASAVHSEQKKGAAFVQPAIQELLRSVGISFSQIDAVAVVNGPGSYTGLRVGLATAKGICYALNKPLIVINTLEVMALAAIKTEQNKNALYCPMIDARRNEVFTAVYDASLANLLPPQGLVIEADSFASWLAAPRQMIFFGSGHNKCEKIIGYYQNASFISSFYTITHINLLAQQHYKKHQFGDIAYTEPFYVKEFYSLGK